MLLRGGSDTLYKDHFAVNLREAIVDLATYKRETAINKPAYEQLRERIRRDYTGQYIALANGQLIAATPTFDEAKEAVHRLDPVPEYYLIFPAEMEPDFELAYDF